MEVPFEKAVREVTTSSGVVGVVCCDSNGLCLSAKGVGKATAAGFAQSIKNNAKSLAHDADEEPFVSIETENMTVAVESRNGVTLCVYKTNNVA